MSKESLDYEKLCSNYYSSWEDGSCMESCEFYNHNECPIVYVNGLLEERDKTIADLEAKLELSKMNESFEKEKKENAWELIEQLKQQLAELKETKAQELAESLKTSLPRYISQDKIEFAVEQLNETYRLLHEKAICVTGTGVNAVRLYTLNEVFKSQIEELKKEIK